MKFIQLVGSHAQNLNRTRNFLSLAVLFLTACVVSGCGGSGSGGEPPATLVITTASLPSGQTGVAYTATLAATGGTPPFTWTVTNGTLPMGLSLNASTGAIAGTPTQSVTGLSLTFKIVDSGNPQQTTSVTLPLTITGGALSLTISPRNTGLTVTQTLAVSATVLNDAMNKGVTWSATGGTFSAMASASGAPVTYTAPSSPGVYTVTATSASDISQMASATIGVTDLHGVLTYHNDLSRDGANTAEYALTTANVNGVTFGKLFSCQADGAIYGQPLWVANVNIGGAKHNIVLAATMHDTVYVFDADASPCVTYWHTQLIPANESFYTSAGAGTNDIFPDIGILGTPVIDSVSNTVYLVTKTYATVGAAVVHQRLHALNLLDGSERTNSPVEIDGSITVPGNCEGGTSVAFNPTTENQRSGLALVNGVVYIAWASHGDHDPYHGWIIGYNTTNLSRFSVFNSSPNAAEGMGYCRGGIWMAGGAPAADSANNLYVITGNGIFDGASAFGDTILELGTAGAISVSDWFTPMDQLNLDGIDSDLGAGGAAVLVDQPSGPHPQLIIGGGKSGRLYLLDRSNMGHFTAGGPDNVVQTLVVPGGSFSTPAFWQNTLYYFGIGGTGKAFNFLTASSNFSTSVASSTASSFNFPASTPSISSNGSSNGIVWTIDSNAFGTSNSGAKNAGPAILHAFDARNLATELWNSSQNAADTAGNAVKFTVPTVANGKVYVPTRGNDSTQGTGTIFGEIDVYGLKPN